MNADNQFPILGLRGSCCNEFSALGRRTGIFFAGVLGTAVLFICAGLVLLFANFLHPVTIMATLLLSLGGALLGLLVGQKSLGLYALIGVVLLMGIVTKNSILLVDYTIMNQQEGKPMYEATLDSGVARLRAILMTTIAIIVGMVPIALGIGAVGKLAARWGWR